MWGHPLTALGTGSHRLGQELCSSSESSPRLRVIAYQPAVWDLAEET